jgi:hypothetical protein
MDIFGRLKAWLSMVFLDTIQYLCTQYREKIIWDRRCLDISTLHRYELAIRVKGGTSKIWGSVDGTLRAIYSLSTVNQRRFYSGHEKMHAFKFQSIMAPDGVISSLAGPVEGPVGDWKLFTESGIEDVLRTIFPCLDVSEWLYLYGDPPYYGGLGIMEAYRACPGSPSTHSQKDFNSHMS